MATFLSTAGAAFPFFVLEYPCSVYRLWTKRTPSPAWTLPLEDICLWRIVPVIGALLNLILVPVVLEFEPASGNDLVSHLVFVATYVLVGILPAGYCIHVVSHMEPILITSSLTFLSTSRLTRRSESPSRNQHTSLESCVIF